MRKGKITLRDYGDHGCNASKEIIRVRGSRKKRCCGLIISRLSLFYKAASFTYQRGYYRVVICKCLCNDLIEI